MKNKYTRIVLISILMLSCHRQNFENIYSKKYLSIEDCKDIELASWILLKETGLDLPSHKIQIVINDYYGGVPLQIQHYPIYYKLPINGNEYNEYKMRLIKNNNSIGWRYSQNDGSLHFVLINKHELSCVIGNDFILFGFRNIDIVAP